MYTPAWIVILAVKLIYPVEINLSLCLLALLFNEPPPQKNNCIKNVNNNLHISFILKEKLYNNIVLLYYHIIIKQNH